MTANRKILALLIPASLLAIAGTAWAGYDVTQEVTVNMSQQTASGVLRDARNSSDDEQFIGCRAGNYPFGTESIYCIANDAAGNLISCRSQNAHMYRMVANLQSGASFSFRVDDGQCIELTVESSSAYL